MSSDPLAELKRSGRKDGNKENEGKEEGEEKGRKGMNWELHIHGNFQNRRL